MQPRREAVTIPGWLWPVNWPLLAAGVWVTVLVVMCVRPFSVKHSNSNFPNFANAARKWFRGGDLYHYAPGESFDVYRYGPTATLLMSPFGELPVRTGEAVWRLCHAGAFLGGLYWWSVAGVPVRLTGKQRAILFLMVMPLSVGSLNNAQTNPLLAGCFLAAATAAVGRRWSAASAVIVLATVFKLYPLAFGLVLGVMWPLRLLPRLALGVAAAAAVPFLLQEPGYVTTQYVEWLTFIGADDRKFWPLNHIYRDAWLLVRLSGAPVSPTAYFGIQLGTAAAVAGLGWWHTRASGPTRGLVTYALSLTVCWIMLFGPSTESSTYIMLAPVLAFACIQTWTAPAARVSRALATTSFVIFLAAAVACWFPFVALVHSTGLQPIATLLLAAAVLSFGVRPESDVDAGAGAPGETEPPTPSAGPPVPDGLAA